MSALADHPVRVGATVLGSRPAVFALDAGLLHGWGWTAVRPAVRTAGWATDRPGRSWTVAGAPALRPAAGVRSRRTRAMLRDWRRRYLLAEVVGTLLAVLAAVVAHAATGSLASAAVAGSVAEAGAYYAVVLRRVLPTLWEQHEGTTPLARRLLRTARGAVTEVSDFLAAELADTLLLRPLLIFLAAGWTGDHVVWGLLIGKLLADAGFYAVVIPTYELKKRLVSR